MYRLGIDLGGTNIAAGIVTEDYRLVRTASVPTGLPRTPQELAAAIRGLAEELLAAEGLGLSEVSFLGIGIPGSVNRKTGLVEYANNLGFQNVPFAELLSQRFSCPIEAENDAKAAAWGEFKAGAGEGVSSMVMMTLGTGIGGAIIMKGELWDGVNSAAGELGHMVIRVGGRPCTCGRRGCFEAYASASALAEQARQTAAAHPDSLLTRLCGGQRARIDGKLLFQAAGEGDPWAGQVLEAYLEDLAEGTANIINLLQPQLLCIGGGLSGAGAALLEPLKQRVLPLLYSRDSSENTRLCLARLGNAAGIIGAAALDTR